MPYALYYNPQEERVFLCRIFKGYVCVKPHTQPCVSFLRKEEKRTRKKKEGAEDELLDKKYRQQSVGALCIVGNPEKRKQYD